MATHKARKWHRFILKKKKKDLYFNFTKGFFTFTWKLKWSSIYRPIYLLLILRQVGRCIPCSAAFDFNFQIVLNYLQMRKDQNIYIKYLLKITFVLPAQILSRSSCSLCTLLIVYLAVKGFFFFFKFQATPFVSLGDYVLYCLSESIPESPCLWPFLSLGSKCHNETHSFVC